MPQAFLPGPPSGNAAQPEITGKTAAARAVVSIRSGSGPAGRRARRVGVEQRTESFEDAAVTSFVGGYAPLPGIRDEMMGPDGKPRAHWIPFLAALGELGPEELRRRIDAADRYLKESGVFYRVYDDAGGKERPWALSHVPLLIDKSDWTELSEGLIERAELLDGLLADLYGPGDMVRNGALPAAAVAGSPEFLRPLVGVKPRGGRFLRFYAADVGRGPDGRWWVLSDRTQAPSGAGYALENRLALTRALPDVSRALRMERLAGFFQSMRTSLLKLDRTGEGRIGLLTPGPLNETYFEHALLARYLGFLLVEGEDLSVRGNALFVRTVAGLRRLDVVLRRLDSDFTDPLELNARSRLGVPGLVHAVRSGGTVLANALGSGLVESPALMAFLPRLATHILGRGLSLPHVGTWWCGAGGGAHAGDGASGQPRYRSRLWPVRAGSRPARLGAGGGPRSGGAAQALPPHDMARCGPPWGRMWRASPPCRSGPARSWNRAPSSCASSSPPPRPAGA